MKNVMRLGVLVLACVFALSISGCASNRAEIQKIEAEMETLKSDIENKKLAVDAAFVSYQQADGIYSEYLLRGMLEESEEWEEIKTQKYYTWQECKKELEEMEREYTKLNNQLSRLR